MKSKMYFFSFLLFLFGCGGSRSLKTVDELDLERYAGTWYEIAKFPNSFEKGLTCITATYSIKENGKVEVLNRGKKVKNGQWQDIRGTAWVPDENEPAKLKVRFFWPFAGNYQVLALDEDYEYALVGEPKRKFLWILSKNPVLDDGIYEELVGIAKQRGFPVELLERVEQDCW